MKNIRENKSYLNYVKLLVLDLKWESCDINVVECGNASKPSKLDDIRTSLRLFELFFDDVLVDMIVGNTYSHREEPHTSFFA